MASFIEVILIMQTFAARMFHVTISSDSFHVMILRKESLTVSLANNEQ